MGHGYLYETFVPQLKNVYFLKNLVDHSVGEFPFNLFSFARFLLLSTSASLIDVSLLVSSSLSLSHPIGVGLLSSYLFGLNFYFGLNLFLRLNFGLFRFYIQSFLD